MNLTDIALIALFFSFLALGFFQGTIKLLITIISFYISLILAGLYFQTVGRFFRQRFGTTAEAGQIVAFAVILLVAFLLLTIAGLYTFRYAKMPSALDFIDRIAGTMLGLVLGALVLGILSEILILYFVNSSLPPPYPIVRMFQGSVRGSFLVGFFANNILPLILNLVRPLLPPGALTIFGA
jgi:uncharacterized membrane protein required for colicin V production